MDDQSRFTKKHEAALFVTLPAILLAVVNELMHPPIWILFVIGRLPLVAAIHLVWPSLNNIPGGGKIVLLLVVVALYAWAGTKLSLIQNDQRFKTEEKDAWRNIQIEFNLSPSDKGNPMKSVITVTNNSWQNLSDRHLLLCQSILVTDPPGKLLDQATMLGTEQQGTWTVVSRFSVSSRRRN